MSRRSLVAAVGGGALLATALAAGCGSAESGPADMFSSLDGIPPKPVCYQLALPKTAFDDKGPYGIRRDELAGDFTVTDQNGEWNFRRNFTGCDSYVIIPDDIPVSALDPTSIWAADLDQLIAKSPLNVHYFFISRKDNPADVQASLEQVASQIPATLATLPEGAGPGEYDWWKARIHLVQTGVRGLTGWIPQLLDLTGPAATTGPGFAIDRRQRLRGLGSLADVNRPDAALEEKGEWPWRNCLAYAAHPPRYFNYEGDRDLHLAAEKGVQEITLYDHEVVGGTVEKEAMLPDAEQMAKFDTLQVDLEMKCPDPDQIENDNCGALDNIVQLHVLGGDGKAWIEVGRFISTYHREGRYLVDGTHAIPELAAGGARRFRYTLGPPGDQQMYESTLRLRFSAQGRGTRPTKAQFLFDGGAFDADYDTNRAPVTVSIPAGAKKVELRAIVTGHGGDADNCAEFCNHQHEFTIGGRAYLKQFNEPGDDEGCLKQIVRGVVPNQSGTWWLGRGGWCPGAQVDPWVIDVTSQAPPGKDLVVSYRGLFRDAPPAVARGNIVLSSWIVVYE